MAVQAASRTIVTAQSRFSSSSSVPLQNARTPNFQVPSQDRISLVQVVAVTVAIGVA